MKKLLFLTCVVLAEMLHGCATMRRKRDHLAFEELSDQEARSLAHADGYRVVAGWRRAGPCEALVTVESSTETVIPGTQHRLRIVYTEGGQQAVAQICLGPRLLLGKTRILQAGQQFVKETSNDVELELRVAGVARFDGPRRALLSCSREGGVALIEVELDDGRTVKSCRDLVLTLDRSAGR